MKNDGQIQSLEADMQVLKKGLRLIEQRLAEFEKTIEEACKCLGIDLNDFENKPKLRLVKND